MTTSDEIQPSGKDTLAAVALLLVGALAVALMPNSAKLAIQDGANTETTVLIRVLTAIPLLCLYMLARGIRFSVPREFYVLTLVASVSSAGMNFCMIYAIQYIDVGLAMLIMFTHPFLIAYYYHIKRVSLLSATRVFWSIAALFGLGLALIADLATISMTGVILAAGASVLTTIMVISMVSVSQVVGGTSTNLHMTIWTLVLTIGVLATVGTLQWPQTTIGWASGIGNGISYMTAYLTFLGAVRLIGGSRASMLTFMEPIAAILMAAWWFGEFLSLVQWGGVALVALGLIFMEAPKGTWTRLRARLGKA